MSQSVLFTYSDAVDHGVSFMGSNSSGDARRDALRAAQAAMLEVPAARRWTYFYQLGRITTNVAQTAGTVAYDHTGGTHERELTLTGATWPTWASLGNIVIGNVPYEVDQRISGSVLTLSCNSNPGADLAAMTPYTLLRDTYPLPIDFIAADQLVAIGSSIAYPTYVHPREWLIPHQFRTSPATPRLYTFTSDPHYFGAMAVRFQPAPDAAYTFDFIYQRRPRQALIPEYKTGTATVTAATSAVTGTGTTWTSKMIGSSIRLSDDATAYPTGLAGLSPFSVERIVTDVSGPTALTVDAVIPDGYASVKYVISDPVDLEDGAMLLAFQRSIEKNLSMARNMKNQGNVFQMYQVALIAAMEADSRSFAERGAWLGEGGSRLPLKYYPKRADIL